MQPNRRLFLRATGVSLAMPCFDAFSPAGADETSESRRRMVCICTPLGLNPDNFIPQETGADYKLTPYLDTIKEFRDDFTVVSGLCHAGVSPGFGHQATATFLTGVPGAGRPGFRNGISVDQFAAEQIGSQTRFSSLALSGGGVGISWTRTGAQVPAYTSPAEVFGKMFLSGRPEEVKAQVRRLRDNRSILDDVRQQAEALHSSLGQDDRDKLDQYVTSVRELEKKLVTDEAWSQKPKPKVDAKPPRDIANKADIIGRSRLMFDITRLALQTDSTRLITIMLSGSTNAPPIPGVSLGHHDLSHHGKDPDKLAQLKIVETETMKTIRELLSGLKQIRESDGNLLDKTIVYLGSNLGNASSHSVKNLPVLLAGGGFRHGNHLSFDPQDPPPLCNLYVSMLQQLGIETDTFGPSSGTLTGLDAIG